jgi:hypothetical protein
MLRLVRSVARLRVRAFSSLELYKPPSTYHDASRVGFCTSHRILGFSIVTKSTEELFSDHAQEDCLVILCFPYHKCFQIAFCL